MLLRRKIKADKYAFILGIERSGYFSLGPLQLFLYLGPKWGPESPNLIEAVSVIQGIPKDLGGPIRKGGD